MAEYDYAMKAAARNGDLQMARYLYENIHIYDDKQLRSVLKATTGRTDIEKYLSANKFKRQANSI